MRLATRNRCVAARAALLGTPLLGVLLLGAAPARAAPQAVAVLPAAVGGDPTTRRDLDELDAAVRAALSAWPDAIVLDEPTTSGALRSAESMGGARCDRATTPCRAELGALLGTALVVAVEGERVGATYELLLTLVDVEGAIELARARGVAAAAPEQLAKDVDVVVAALLSPEARLARLILDAPPGARLFVDGAETAARTIAVAPGAHVVEARQEGALPARADVAVAAGERRTIALAPRAIGGAPDAAAVAAAQVDPADAPGPLAGALVGGAALAGVGVALGAGALGFGLWSNVEATRLQALAAGATDGAGVAAALDEARALQGRVGVQRAVALGLGVAAGLAVVVGAAVVGVAVVADPP